MIVSECRCRCGAVHRFHYVNPVWKRVFDRMFSESDCCDKCTTDIKQWALFCNTIRREEFSVVKHTTVPVSEDSERTQIGGPVVLDLHRESSDVAVSESVV